MELNITTQKENPLLHRKELHGELTFQGATPSNKQLQEELAKKLNVGQEVLAIRHIFGAFGGAKAKFEAYAYTSKEQFDKIEPKKKQKAAAPGTAPAAPAK
jgi:small subunit ribosomal protein S24e